MVFFNTRYNYICLHILQLLVTSAPLRVQLTLVIVAELALYEHPCFAASLWLTCVSLNWGIILRSLLSFWVIYNITNVYLSILLLDKPFQVLWQRPFHYLSVAVATTPYEWSPLIILQTFKSRICVCIKSMVERSLDLKARTKLPQCLICWV